MENEQPDNWKKKPYNRYIQYTSISFQIIAIMLIGIFSGKMLDDYFKTSSPYFTLSFSVAAIFISIYFLIKEFLKK